MASIKEISLPHGTIPTQMFGNVNLQNAMMYVNENFAEVKSGVNDAVAAANEAIDAKADADHDHDEDYAALEHTHAQSEITGLQSALDDKAALNHEHSQYLTSLPAHYHATSDVQGLDERLQAKAESVHTHTIADVENLTTELGVKASTTYVDQQVNSVSSSIKAIADAEVESYAAGNTDVANTPVNVEIAPTNETDAQKKARIGTSASYARKDHKHVFNTESSDLTKLKHDGNGEDGAASFGSESAVPRIDHSHPLNFPSDKSTSTMEHDGAGEGGAALFGSTNQYADLGHSHPLNVTSTGTPSDVVKSTGTASLGDEPTYARTDHVHKMPALEEGDISGLEDDLNDINTTVDDHTSRITALEARPVGGVTSVNNKTGAVVLDADDVGAAASDHTHGMIDSVGELKKYSGAALVNANDAVVGTSSSGYINAIDGMTATNLKLIYSAFVVSNSVAKIAVANVDFGDGVTNVTSSNLASQAETVGLLTKTVADTYYAALSHDHTTADITDWSTALANYVTTNTAQTISGAKTFSTNVHTTKTAYIDATSASAYLIVDYASGSVRGYYGCGDIWLDKNAGASTINFRDYSRNIKSRITYNHSTSLLCIDALSANNAVLAYAPTLAATNTTSLAIATCGWASNLFLSKSAAANAYAAISHTHGNITNDGKLGTASKIVVTDTNKSITCDTILSPSTLATIQAAATVVDNDNDVLKKFILSHSSSSSGITLDATTSSSTIRLGYSSSVESTIVGGTTGVLSLNGVTGLTLSAPADTVKLANAPTVDTSSTSSLVVATCGWVSNKFLAKTGLTTSSIYGTNSDGDITAVASLLTSAPSTNKVLTVKSGSTSLTWEDGGGNPENPTSKTTANITSEGTSSVNTTSWTYAGTNGMQLTVCSRVMYDHTASTPVLYGFYRTWTFDKKGQLYSISEEKRYEIDTPVVGNLTT